jgi:hypothetical protein
MTATQVGSPVQGISGVARRRIIYCYQCES